MTYRYEFRTSPWEHQREAIRRAWQEPGFGWLMEMGTGKSKVAVDEAAMLAESGETDGALILAPKGVVPNWVRERGELRTHMPERLLERAMIVDWQSGAGKAHTERLGRLLEPWDGTRYLVMNSEALGATPKASAFAEAFLRSGRFPIYVDESTKFKNPSAGRTKWLQSLGKLAPYRRIMTGTPAPRDPLDLFAQFNFILPGILGSSYYAFRARYAILREIRVGGRKQAIVVGFRNVEELAERIAPHSYRVRKEECLDLPPKVYETREVPLTDEQARVYHDLRDDALTMLGDGYTSTQAVITQLIRLHQVVCGFLVLDDGRVIDLPSNRQAALDEVLEEAPGKTIVWAHYRHQIDQIVAELRRRGGERAVAQFHGGNASTRHEDEQRFKEDPDCLWMVASQGAGGYGNTWTVASTEVYASNSYDLEHRLQSEDRPHRAGQTEKVAVVDLTSPGTVEVPMVMALRAKLDVASLITRDGARAWLV